MKIEPGSKEDLFWHHRFRHLVGKPENFCRPWLGEKDEQGNGVFMALGRLRKARELAFELQLGRALAAGMTVFPKCRRRDCVHPFCMEVVTIARARSKWGRKAR